MGPSTDLLHIVKTIGTFGVFRFYTFSEKRRQELTYKEMDRVEPRVGSWPTPAGGGHKSPTVCKLAASCAICSDTQDKDRIVRISRVFCFLHFGAHFALWHVGML